MFAALIFFYTVFLGFEIYDLTASIDRETHNILTYVGFLFYMQNILLYIILGKHFTNRRQLETINFVNKHKIEKKKYKSFASSHMNVRYSKELF